VSHPNAALTPRARLRLACLIVERNWPVTEAAKMFMVSERTARKWADRYRLEGEAGMTDRSSRPHHSPARTPEPVVREIVVLRWRHRLGPVQISGRLGVPASTVHAVLVRCRINRLSRIDRVTGEPLRRYEHPHPGSLIHVDVTKFGNIPDGGGHRYVGRQQGNATEEPPQACLWETTTTRAQAGPSCTRLSTTTPASPTSRSTPTNAAPPRSTSSDGPSPGSVSGASSSNESCPTTAPPTAPTPGATRAPNSASHRNAPAPTGPRPTARSNDSTAPWPTAGPTPATTSQKPNAAQPCPAGCTSTITTEPTPPSEASHPSPG
jgi:hypothetical protein